VSVHVCDVAYLFGGVHSGPVTNRLASATSPYLQQHADNPVDWWEWGPEAFAEAERRDVPVLVSIGYAACHWCHVMAHESFEDAEVADQLNRRFVAIKVDREERPDVDAVYMAATVAMTGMGGWPMTVFVTPGGRPFFAGTYFPAEPMAGLVSFRQVLTAVDAAWLDRRREVEGSAAAVSRALADQSDVGHSPAGVLDRAVADAALVAARAVFDTSRGGFGDAPKFPPSMLLEWLLRRAARPGATDDRSSLRALEMASVTLRAMARGGMYDQLAGGFARYSVGASWAVPHFEKMLYDNAQLLRVYAHWWRLTADPLAARVVTETAEWLLSELRTGEGAFASSLDADSRDSDGVLREGAFYVWTRDELLEVLGPDDGAWVADLCRVFDGGSFERGTSTLQLPADPDDLERWSRLRARLREVRGGRPRPARDDKVVTAWNGLAIAALADAGSLFERPLWVEAAADAASHLLRVHVRPDAGGRLVRASRDGAAGAAPGVLEDYADLAEGLLALVSATGEARWLEAAGALLDAVLTGFVDDDGVLYDTAGDATDPVLAGVRRPREVTDGPVPSGTAAAAGALLTYAAFAGSSEHRRVAEWALAASLVHAPQSPLVAGWALAVLEAHVDGPRQVAVCGPVDDPATVALHRVAVATTAPGAVVVSGLPDAPGLPLLAGRPLVAEKPTAYVCRGFVCERPTTDLAELAAQLSAADPRG
jgi:uncharacterized protein